jgi:hypothetical protein
MRMKNRLAALSSLALVACGSNPDAKTAEPASPGVKSSASATTFKPPAPGEGYTRIVAPTIKDIGPGSDQMYCQHVQAPFDHDVDILDLTGYQSAFGHHAVAYASKSDVPVGTSGACTDADNLSGAFLGGIGGEGTGGVKLPEGVAFRLTKGSGIMLNTHFLNTGADTIDGDSVIDIKYADVDPERKTASFFVNGNMGFDVPGNGTLQATAECTAPRDLEFLMFTNHMHDHGTHALTEVVRATGGATELVHEDPTWTYDMQFNADYTRWTVAEPFTIAKGDVLRTYCNWDNTTASDLTFPREMCFGVGFFLAPSGAAATSPVCLDGKWIESY